jgi:allantoinase
MKARVASTWLRGTEVWDGTEVKAKPGSGRFVPRQHKKSVLDA